MSSKKNSWKAGAIAFAVCVVAFLAIIVGVSSGNNFNHEHRDEITRAGYEPAPEVNRYHISTSLAWEATNDGAAGVFKGIGYFTLGILGLYLLAVSTSRITYYKDQANKISFVTLVVIAACVFGAYSATYVGNWVDVSPDVHKSIQDNKDVLIEIFKSKELIK